MGSIIAAGQLIANVGKMFVDSMLHLEMYTGSAHGKLTDRKNDPFQRRSDLVDPTPLLDRLTFHVSSPGSVVHAGEGSYSAFG